MIFPNNTIPKQIDAMMFPILALTESIEKINIDGQQVTLDGEPLSNRKGEVLDIDATTFRCIGMGFFADKHKTYGLSFNRKSNSQKIYLTVIKNVDVNSFETVNLYYAKDKNNYYYSEGGKTIKASQHQLFQDQYLNNRFSERKETNSWMSKFLLTKDKVYYKGSVLKNADPNTFERAQQFLYKDKNQVFVSNNVRLKSISDVDMDSLILFPKGGATDKYKTLHAYEYNQEMIVDDLPYFEKFFEPLRGKISADYWYYKLKDKIG